MIRSYRARCSARLHHRSSQSLNRLERGPGDAKPGVSCLTRDLPWFYRDIQVAPLYLFIFRCSSGIVPPLLVNANNSNQFADSSRTVVPDINRDYARYERLAREMSLSDGNKTRGIIMAG